MTNVIHDGISDKISDALQECIRSMRRTLELEEADHDTFRQCFRDKVREHTRWTYRCMATLPRGRTGRRVSVASREGHIMVQDLYGIGMTFGMTVIIQPY